MSEPTYKNITKDWGKNLNQKIRLACESDTNHSPKSQKMKILVIDDTKDIRDVLSEMIASEGHEVIMAPDGKSGLEMIESNAFDVVLLDLLMPGRSGLQVIDSLEKTAMIKLNKIIELLELSVPLKKKYKFLMC